MATKAQLSKMHVLLAQTGQKEHKSEMVMGFTDGRTESSKEMTDQELMQMIEHLEAIMQRMHGTNYPPAAAMHLREAKRSANEIMKRKVISMAHECGWKKPNGKIDMGAINSWCIKYGYLHKRLDDHTYQELPKLITQFENGPYLAHLKKV